MELETLNLEHFLVDVIKELPEQWNNTKKLAISIKQQVAPLQANEVANIRRKLSDFDTRQQEFRDDFHKMAAFSYSCVYPYDELDRVGLLAAYLLAMRLYCGIVVVYMVGQKYTHFQCIYRFVHYQATANEKKLNAVWFDLAAREQDRVERDWSLSENTFHRRPTADSE